jgi:hypothetical protein
MFALPWVLLLKIKICEFEKGDRNLRRVYSNHIGARLDAERSLYHGTKNAGVSAHEP